MSPDLVIAIVDDDCSARTALASLVRSLGFIAIEFRNAADFLQSDCLLQTDCLVSDVRMPEMTGPQLYRHLVASNHPIPTILVTAYADCTARATALEAGVHCYLAKPLAPDQLLDCIRSALAQRSGVQT